MSDRSALNQVRSLQVLTGADALLADHTSSSFDGLGESLSDSRLDPFPDEVAEASAASPLAGTDHAIAEALLTSVNFEALVATRDATALADGHAAPIAGDIVHALTEAPTPASPIEAVVDAALSTGAAAPADSALAVPSALLGQTGGLDGIVQAASSGVTFELGRAQLGLTALAHGDAGPLLADVTNGLQTPPSGDTSPVQAIVDAALPSVLATPVDAVLAVPSALLGQTGGLDGIAQAVASGVNFELGRAQLGLTALAHGDAGPLLADVTNGLQTPPSGDTSPVQAIVDAALPSTLATPVDSVLAVPSALLGQTGGLDGIVQAASSGVSFELGRAELGLTALAHGDAGPLLADVTNGLQTPPSGETSPVQAIVDAALPSTLATPVDSVLAVPSALLGQTGGLDGIAQAASSGVSFELGRAELGLTALAHGDAGPLLADVTNGLQTPPSGDTSPVQAIVDAALPSVLATPVDGVLAVPSALLGQTGGLDGIAQAVASGVSFELGRAELGLTALSHGDAGPLLADVTNGLQTPPSGDTSPVQAIVDAALPSALATPVDSVLAVPSALLGQTGGLDGIAQAVASGVSFELGRAELGLTALSHGDAGPLLADVTNGLQTPPSGDTSPVQAIVDAALPSALATPVDSVFAVPSALLGQTGGLDGIAQAVASGVSFELGRAELGLTALAHGDAGPLLADVTNGLQTPPSGDTSPVQAIVDAALPSALAAPVDSVLSVPSALLGQTGGLDGIAQAVASGVSFELDRAELGLTALAHGDAGPLLADVTNGLQTPPSGDTSPVQAIVDAALPSALAAPVDSVLAVPSALLDGDIAAIASPQPDLAPVAGLVADAASAGNGVAESVAGAANALASAAQGEGGATAAQVTGSVASIGGALTTAANDLVATAHGDLGGAVGDVGGTVASIGGTVTGALAETGSLVPSEVGGVVAPASAAAVSLASAAGGVLNGGATSLQGDAATVAASATGAAAMVGGSVAGAVDATVATLHADVVPVVADLTAAAGTLATTATGAVGETLAAVQADVGALAGDVVTAGASLSGTVSGVAAVAQAEVAHVAADVTTAATLAAATASGATSAALTGATQLVGTTLTETASVVHVSVDTAATGVAGALTTVGAAVAEATASVHADVASVAGSVGSTLTSVTGAAGADLSNVASAVHADAAIVSGEVGAVAGTATGAVGTAIAEATATGHADLAGLATGLETAAATATGALEAGLTAAPAALSTAIVAATGVVGTASADLTHAAGSGSGEAGSAVTAGLAAVTGNGSGAASTATGAIGAGLAEATTVAHDAALTTTAALTVVTNAAPTVTSLVTIVSADTFHFPTSSGAGIDALHGIVASSAAPVTSVPDTASHAVVAAVVEHVEVPHVDPLAALAHAVHHA